MTMFVQLLVFSCACALVAADEAPSYGDIYPILVEAYGILLDNVLSMDNNVPLLNDSRRHYAEIIHVVHDEAQKLNTKRLGPDYYRDYQTNINVAAPFAIANPQSVVDDTNKVIEDIINNIDKMLQLVIASAQNSNQDSDKAIDEEMNKNIEKYGVLPPFGEALLEFAKQLINDHKQYFAASAQNLSAHNFVITGAEKLEKIVKRLTTVYQFLYPPSDVSS